MKKPSVVSFLITLLLAAAVCTHGNEQVKDSSGVPVEVGQQYFIQPVKTDANRGGGLVPAATSFPFCPLGITPSPPSQPGLPVVFVFPFPTPKAFVDTSDDVNIVFKSDIWICPSKIWAVDTSPSANEVPDIVTGGVMESRNSTFKIENPGEGEGTGANTYKLTNLDGTVGLKKGFWGLQLALTKDSAKPVLVKFKKFDDPSTARVEKLGLRMFPFY